MKKKRQVWLVAAGILVLAILVGGALLLEHLGGGEQEETHGMTVEDVIGNRDNVEPAVFYNGVWYGLKPNVETYLLMGIDHEGEVAATEGYNIGGQADVLLLLVLDSDSREYSILQLNRDTMTEVEVLGVTGDVVGKYVQQIALSHGYGDGSQISCENTVRAVSNLLYGTEISGYAALQMDAIAVVNDMVGGVSVRLEDDLSAVDPSFVPGKTVTLTGEKAIAFLRARTALADDSNLARMGRHRTYLNALDAAVRAQSEGNGALISEIYTALQSYMVTNVNGADVSRLAQLAGEYTDRGTLTIDGEARMGEKFMEFFPDETALKETVLELFYTPVADHNDK